MDALETLYVSELDTVALIETASFTLVTPYFLSIARFTKNINVYPVPKVFASVFDAMQAFINAISIRNENFKIVSGQQSCAEFLSYLLSLLRKEALLVKAISELKTKSFVDHSIITETFIGICDLLDKADCIHDKTPIDEYFSNRIQVSLRCQNCQKSQFHNIFSTFTLEASHRYFTGKNSRKLIMTKQLLNLYLRGNESSNDSDIVSHFTCFHCNHNLGIEELKLIELAKNVIMIYDRIVSSHEEPINTTILSPLEITALSTKSLTHWYLETELHLNQVVLNEASSSRSLLSAVFHKGPSIVSGHYIAVSTNSSVSNQNMTLYNDNIVIENVNLFPLLRDPESPLIENYGNAVIALYGKSDKLPLRQSYPLTQIDTPTEYPFRQPNNKKNNSTSRKRKYRKRKSSDVKKYKKQCIKNVVGKDSMKTYFRQYRKKTREKPDRRFTFDTTHEDYEKQSENGNYFNCNDYQLYPETAVMLYHLNSGSYAFHNLKDDLSKQSTRDKIKKEIREQKVSNEKKEQIIKDFDTQLYSGVNNMPFLITCGCCGIREYERGSEKVFSRERGGVRYKMTPLEKVTALRYSEMDELLLRAKLKKEPVSIPIDAFHTQRLIVPEEAISYYHDRKNNRYYHLHREFVEEDSKGDAKVQICHDCYYSLFPDEATQTLDNNPRIPDLSIAAGVDFGDFNRIYLTEPNTFERIILSQVRPFITVLKLIDNTGQKRDYTQSVLRGHAITFDHDAPVVANSVLESLKTATSSFKIHLFCDDGKRDILFEKMRGSSLILGRPYVIYQWLLVLKRINEFYHAKGIPDFTTIQKTVDEANTEVFDTMYVCNDENVLLNELEEGNDVAEIRTTTQSKEKQNNSTGVPSE